MDFKYHTREREIGYDGTLSGQIKLGQSATSFDKQRQVFLLHRASLINPFI